MLRLSPPPPSWTTELMQSIFSFPFKKKKPIRAAMAADPVLKRRKKKKTASSYCWWRIHFEKHFKADPTGERIMLNICYEIFIRAQKQLTKLPRGKKISVSPHLDFLRWGF